jgi:hypothetical protein
VALPSPLRYPLAMDFDQLLVRFFGTEDIAALQPEQLLAGVDRLRLQFGLEKDAGRRFAYWCLLYMLGAAPDLEEAFEDEGDREAARDFMEAAEREMDSDD